MHARSERSSCNLADVAGAVATTVLDSISQRGQLDVGVCHNVPRMEQDQAPAQRAEQDQALAWYKSLRVVGLAVASLFIGFLVALLLFGEPWHLPPDWGDIPTWLLVVLGAAGGWVALAQLSILRQQIADEAERNNKRDKLLDKQLEMLQRQQAENVKAIRTSSPNGSSGYVANDSDRPIRAITCKIMSKVDRHNLASPARCGVVERTPGGWQFPESPKPVPDLENLLPHTRGCFTFPDLRVEPDHVLVAWFTDDAGFRWQLDENLHLVTTDDESEYLP
jgi:hypothetical protein